tara:strand:+ start:588 stop:785 length:198 start_codon:yes stop_codon:yes gene_type:complete
MELILPFIFASHRPDLSKEYNWHMSCSRWHERSQEIMKDENLPINQRKFLVRYLRSKVEGECNFT